MPLEYTIQYIHTLAWTRKKAQLGPLLGDVRKAGCVGISAYEHFEEHLGISVQTFFCRMIVFLLVVHNVLLRYSANIHQMADFLPQMQRLKFEFRVFFRCSLPVPREVH